MTIQRKRNVAIGLLIGTILLLVALLLWIELTTICSCLDKSQGQTIIASTYTAATATASVSY